jgi:hypothetical protein
MKSFVSGTCIVLLLVGALWAQNIGQAGKRPAEGASIAQAVDRGARWLASVQGSDGGWGQDGGETSYIRNGERLESNGNDVANTAVAALALIRAGKRYQPNVDRALEFILKRVEASAADGLAITDSTGTQIQRKLGPYIDTFLTSMLLAQVDGTLSRPALNARVRKALEKCVAKIERNQKSDGSWNVAGGWASVLGTSMASRSLYEAQQKGVKVEPRVMARADSYAFDAISVGAAGAGVGGGRMPASAEAAGVPLYQSAQALEQLSRTPEDRRKNAKQIAAINAQLSNTGFVNGFGSMGGEEFFSYLNISDSLKRAGGAEWNKWHSQITQKILALQNNDGTWAGHHCITGRVAVTSAAILNLGIDHGN